MYSQEKKGFSSWTNHHSGEKRKNLKSLWNLTGSYKESYRADTEKGLSDFLNKLDRPQSNTPVVPIRRFSRVWQIAAAIVVLVAAGYLFKIYQGSSTDTQLFATEENIKSSLELADRSQISLNELSELYYPENFSGNERIVQLTGEGFFDIAEDDTKPFIIETSMGDIKVLGTKFNVRAYPGDDLLEVYVAEGKVAVTLHQLNKRYTLVAGEKLSFQPGHEVEVTIDEEEHALAWQNGKLVFKGHPLQNVLNELEKLYKLEFEVADPAILNCPVTTTIQVGKLEESIKTIQLICPLSAEKKSDSTYLINGSCCR